MDKVYVIIGPTASGKTSKSIEIAKEHNGVVINGDAFQVYKHLDIGTAKIKEEEKQGVKHLMFSYVEPTTEYDVVKWRKDVYANIKDILKEGKTPIICGGSNLYINSLVYNYNFQDGLARNNYEGLSNDELWEKLNKVDPKQAELFHSNNRRRVERALDMASAGKIKSEVDKSNQAPLYNYIIVKVGEEFEREALYERINKRVDIMMEEGLLKEVTDLHKQYDFNLRSFQGIGYKEWLPFFDKKATQEEVVETIKMNSRRYAKKQLTWIKKHY